MRNFGLPVNKDKRIEAQIRAYMGVILSRPKGMSPFAWTVFELTRTIDPFKPFFAWERDTLKQSLKEIRQSVRNTSPD